MTLEYAGLLNFVRICVHGGRILHALLRIFVYSAEHMRPPNPCTNQVIWADDAGMHGEDGRRQSTAEIFGRSAVECFADGWASWNPAKKNVSNTISSKKTAKNICTKIFM